MDAHLEIRYCCTDQKTGRFIPLEISKDELIEFYLSGNTLPYCAKKFGCSIATIKRRLRSFGIDTRTNALIGSARGTKNSHANKNIPDNEIIRKMYVDDNLDSFTIAEKFGISHATILSRMRDLGVKKSRHKVFESMANRHYLKHGYRFPAQRPDILSKTRKSTIKITYESIRGLSWQFRSLHELSFALYLDFNNKEWVYEEITIPYVDMLTGKHRSYTIDFTILSGNVEWVEVKPNENMIPTDKRVYAERRAEDAGVVYRGLSEIERNSGWELLQNGYRIDNYDFVYGMIRKDQNKITRWFKNLEAATNYKIDGWSVLYKPKKFGSLYKVIYCRNNENHIIAVS